MTADFQSLQTASVRAIRPASERLGRPVRQRDLTRAMKAAKAAGFDTFELLDPASGLTFRAIGGGSPPPEEDLDVELRRFEARSRG
jgi:hypothetical protein